MAALPALTRGAKYGHLFCPFPVFLNQAQQFLGDRFLGHIIEQLMQPPLQP
ncbi:hypothetical protein SXCC_03451 [Gluconacetobacter sp. SXCC-1]|nr:hypothetical protein SXCC_03451 [Gluconacetobacter sp. SXCC-1]